MYHFNSNKRCQRQQQELKRAASIAKLKWLEKNRLKCFSEDEKQLSRNYVDKQKNYLLF